MLPGTLYTDNTDHANHTICTGWIWPICQINQKWNSTCLTLLSIFGITEILEFPYFQKSAKLKINIPEIWKYIIPKIHVCRQTYIYVFMCVGMHAWMSNVCMSIYVNMYQCMHVCIHVCMCHKGVVFQTIKSFVHALGIYLQMTEATNK